MQISRTRTYCILDTATTSTLAHTSRAEMRFAEEYSPRQSIRCETKRRGLRADPTQPHG